MASLSYRDAAKEPALRCTPKVHIPWVGRDTRGCRSWSSPLASRSYRHAANEPLFVDILKSQPTTKFTVEDDYKADFSEFVPALHARAAYCMGEGG